MAKGIQWDGGPYTGTFFVYGAFDCRTSPYRPAIFTAADDDTVGDPISGSTGTPTNYYRGALWFDTTNSVVLEHVHVRYAITGCSINSVTSPTLRHLQFVYCGTALEKFRDNASFQNILIDKSYLAIKGWSANLTAEHLTVDGSALYSLFFNNVTNATYPTPSTLAVTNSLLVGISYSDSYTGSWNATNSSASTTFQTIGAASHYLTANSPYRNSGTTNISASLLADLKKLTTYPPVVLTNDFSVSTTLSPQAQRDTDAPDLGFHYSPLDYCWSGLSLNSATLTLTNGVAIGFYGTNGLILKNGAVVVGEGTPANLNRLTRYHTVQEQPVVWGAKANAMLAMTGTYTPLPIVRLRFTDIPALALGTTGPGDRSFFYESQNILDSLTLVDCQMRGSTLYYTPHDASYASYVLMTNNLAERGNFYVQRSSTPTPLTVNFRNNVFWRTGFYIWYDYYSGGSNPSWDIKDNLFDNCSMTEGGTNYTSYILNSYNGYVGTAVLLASSSGHDQTPTNFTYAIGALGPWYQSSTNLIDQGSVTNAALAGLYHYTTQTSQAKEANTALDVGFHYVALDGNGNPNDGDTDGLPDYFEDRNGNGVADTGETNWQDRNDLGLKVWITEPKNNSNIP